MFLNKQYTDIEQITVSGYDPNNLSKSKTIALGRINVPLFKKILRKIALHNLINGDSIHHTYESLISLYQLINIIQLAKVANKFHDLQYINDTNNINDKIDIADTMLYIQSGGYKPDTLITTNKNYYAENIETPNYKIHFLDIEKLSKFISFFEKGKINNYEDIDLSNYFTKYINELTDNTFILYKNTNNITDAGLVYVEGPNKKFGLFDNDLPQKSFIMFHA